MKKYYLSIGNACNLKCRFCYNDLSREKKQFFKEIDEINKEIEKIDINSFIVIVGGEPLLYPNIFDLIDKLTFLGFKKILIVTNGIQLYNEDILDKIIKYNNLLLEISIHSNSEKLEYLITQRKGNFSKKEEGIIKLNSLKDNSGIYSNIVVNSYNVKELDNIVKYIYSLGIKNINLSAIYNLNGFSLENFKSIVSYSDIIDKLDIINNIQGINLSIHWIPLCIHNKIKNINYKIRELNYLKINNNVGESKKIEYKNTSKKCINCFAYGKYCNGIFDFYLTKFGDQEFFTLTEKDILEFEIKNKK